MPIEIRKIDTLQTRVYQSFVNLTKYSSTSYPAITSVRISQPENCTTCEALTSVSIYDQWALRVLTNTAPATNITA